VVEGEVRVGDRASPAVGEVEEPEVEAAEGCKEVVVGTGEIVCRAEEVREVQAEAADAPAAESDEVRCLVAEEGVVGVDRGEVFQDEAGVEVVVEECGEGRFGLVPPAREVAARVEDDVVGAGPVGRFGRLCEGPLSVQALISAGERSS
jgi:hypothetical protein